MSTVLLQDDFRGSGALAGTDALAKASGVSAWADAEYSGTQLTHFARSVDGARLVVDAAGSGTYSDLSLTAATPLGSGAFVTEVEFRGPLLLQIGFDAYAQSVGIALDFGSSGSTNVMAQSESFGPTSISTAAHPYGSTNAYRLRAEIDGTDFRLYVNGSLVATEAWAVSSSAVIDAVSLRTNSDHDPVPTTYGIINYINSVVGTTSGALGPVGAAGGSGATSLGLVTTFGTPSLPGYATGEAPTTAFGTPAGAGLNYATTLGYITHFGTAAQSYNKTLDATSVGNGTAFGTPGSIRAFMPAPIGLASWLAPATAFGTPAFVGTIALTATGLAPNAVPTPKALLAQAAAGSLFGNFGTPIIGTAVAASGFRSTSFGTPTTLQPFTSTGTSKTAFGTPRSKHNFAAQATGWLTTTLGSPNGAVKHTRTRSGVFRTQFGLAQAERTSP